MIRDEESIRSSSPCPDQVRDGSIPLLPAYFLELVHRLKNPLVSVKTFTQLLQFKFDDAEFREYFYRIVLEDIDQIDSVLEGLLEFIKISTPVKKTDTIHKVLEEILKKHQPQIEKKEIKVIKNFGKCLPETILLDEQVKYALHSVLRYALASIPLRGSIGFLTKQVDLQANEGLSPLKAGTYIQILILVTALLKSTAPVERALGMLPSEEEVIDLELRLVKEVLQKNRGTLGIEADEGRLRTIISLWLPAERRTLYCHPSPLENKE